jgi:hypothetical protein
MRHFFENKTTQKHLLTTGQVGPSSWDASKAEEAHIICSLFHQIDRNGRVIDLEKNKSKLHIIEQEFKSAERIEYWRQKEEEDMRVSRHSVVAVLIPTTSLIVPTALQYRVQQKRHAALERARSQDKLAKLKEDRSIRREIVSATRESFGLKYPAPRSTKGTSNGSRTGAGNGPNGGGSYFE